MDISGYVVYNPHFAKISLVYLPFFRSESEPRFPGPTCSNFGVDGGI